MSEFRQKPDESLAFAVEIEEMLKVAHLARRDFSLEQILSELNPVEPINHGYAS